MTTVMLVALGHDPIESELDLEWVLAGGQARAVRHPEEMGVNGDGRLAESDVEHHVGGLAADTWERHQRLAIFWHLAVKLVDKLAGQRDQVLGLASVKSDGLDLVGEL